MDKPKYLFIQESLDAFFASRKDELKREVFSLSDKDFLKFDAKEFVEHLISRYFIEAPVLLEDDATQDEPIEADVDVSRDPDRDIRDRSRPYYLKGAHLRIRIPFKGNASLFRYQPSSLSGVHPQGEIQGSAIVMDYKVVTVDPKMIKKLYTENLDRIKQHLRFVTNDATKFNGELQSFASGLVQNRLARLKDFSAKAVAIGIPIRKREDSAPLLTIKPVRKNIQIQKAAPAASVEPKPLLDESTYQEIIGTIKRLALAMERSPKTFSHLKEEELRDFFLVILNDKYEGQATGETFNYSGKTDILVRWNGKNIFIGECKFWSGPKGFGEALDQILGYLSWRDTKAALIIFNRGTEFGSLLQKIQEATKAHKCFVKAEAAQDETTFRYQFRMPEDQARHLTLTVIAFNVPAGEKLTERG